MGKLKNKIDAGITRFYLEADIEFIKESLEQEGMNLAEEDKKIDKYLKRLKFECKANISQERQRRLLDLAVEKFKDAIEKNIDKPIATLKSLIASNELKFQNRNLEKLSEEEIREIIEGKNLVDLLDTLGESDDED